MIIVEGRSGNDLSLEEKVRTFTVTIWYYKTSGITCASLKDYDVTRGNDGYLM